MYAKQGNGLISYLHKEEKAIILMNISKEEAFVLRLTFYSWNFNTFSLQHFTHYMLALLGPICTRTVASAFECISEFHISNL